jgi:hypothetical protein
MKILKMKKKFRIRVKWFYKDFYCVQYAYYTLFHIWHSLKIWRARSLTDELNQSWGRRCFYLKEAEELAKSLKSIKDIEKYYEAEELVRKNFYKAKEEYYRENVTYKIKEF